MHFHFGFMTKSHRGYFIKGCEIMDCTPIISPSSHAVINKGQPVTFLGKQITISIWHKRLGHPSNPIVSQILRKSKVSCSTDSLSMLCSTCLEGKFTKLPFPSHASKSVLPFAVIHSDVWGPAPCMSIEGYRYYVSFIDECTRYTWIFPIINKAAVFGLFVQFHSFVLNSFDAHIKILQSDGGGEFIGASFQSFLREKGITHQKSCPYTPE